MKIYQVRERIGGDYHVYDEFESPIEARKYISKLDGSRAIEVKQVDKKD